MSESESDKLLKFPCSFPIKMMGRASAGFSDIAVQLVEQHVGKVAADAIQTSESRNGNFVSVTITINAQSQEQLDNIYNDLSDHEKILVAFMTLPAENLPQSDLIVVRTLGLRDYEPLWRGMQQFTESRSPQTPDEIWFTEHPPVFTLGLNASRDHLLTPGDIPVIQVDRGGQVTYHGLGQLMIYTLIDLKRARLGVRDLVTALEQTVIDLVAEHGIEAASRKDAPGVYVEERKIAAVGLRVRRGASYHGMALNIEVNLEPFSRINPCGFNDLEVTDLGALGIGAEPSEIQARVQLHLLKHLRMDDREIVSDV